MEKSKLRIAYLVVNAFFYLMFVGVSIFMVTNVDGIVDLGMMHVWLTLWFVTLIGSVSGSVYIVYWIKKGKL